MKAQWEAHEGRTAVRRSDSTGNSGALWRTETEDIRAVYHCNSTEGCRTIASLFLRHLPGAIAEASMGYVERNLAPGETLAYKTGCHWIVMFWPIVGGAIIGFFGFAFFTAGWLATRNGGRYEGAMVWGGLLCLALAP